MHLLVLYNDISKCTSFKENDKTINPISLYGITKKMNEELA